jgi:hypothetical protein
MLELISTTTLPASFLERSRQCEDKGFGRACELIRSVAFEKSLVYVGLLLWRKKMYTLLLLCCLIGAASLLQSQGKRLIIVV